jgi:hypothetical protein
VFHTAFDGLFSDGITCIFRERNAEKTEILRANTFLPSPYPDSFFLSRFTQHPTREAFQFHYIMTKRLMNSTQTQRLTKRDNDTAKLLQDFFFTAAPEELRRSNTPASNTIRLSPHDRLPSTPSKSLKFKSDHGRLARKQSYNYSQNAQNRATSFSSVTTALTRFIMTDWQQPAYPVWLSTHEISKAVAPSIHPGIVLNTTLFQKVIQATLDSMVFWTDFHQPADQSKLLFKNSHNGNEYFAVRPNWSKFPPPFVTSSSTTGESIAAAGQVVSDSIAATH